MSWNLARRLVGAGLVLGVILAALGAQWWMGLLGGIGLGLALAE